MSTTIGWAELQNLWGRNSLITPPTHPPLMRAWKKLDCRARMEDTGCSITTIKQISYYLTTNSWPNVSHTLATTDWGCPVSTFGFGLNTVLILDFDFGFWTLLLLSIIFHTILAYICISISAFRCQWPQIPATSLYKTGSILDFWGGWLDFQKYHVQNTCAPPPLTHTHTSSHQSHRLSDLQTPEAEVISKENIPRECKNVYSMKKNNLIRDAIKMTFFLRNRLVVYILNKML